MTRGDGDAAPEVVDRPDLPEWAAAQRRWLTPTVVGRFGIHPPWCDPVGDVPVSIDPGPTFGHGAHPTTALVLAEVDRLAGTGPALLGTEVLDVGCGSGVLAVAAACLGAGPVVGIDVEDDAVAWTLYNAAANGVEVAASTTPVSDVAGAWGLVLANVLPVVHDGVAAAVAARVAPTGTLVVSGSPEEDADRVAGLYRAEGLAEVRRTSSDGWAGLVFARDAVPAE
ncbi:MAG: 50S ribosomal protein L11 methyltransferase [Actinomycetota bacterium]|nr:50S ribosomal protein L11 methyltransferase [Actinomycetota bacterium]MEC9394963.1 50S ribosomal protein L11 methyltransferase [Actinomycetota bacterium]MEE2957431.1 50S ribosomal protein L11 methyltransferase [Actinomycetota bacterium]